MRQTWFDADDLAARPAIARQIQLQVWQDVPNIPLGSAAPLTALRHGIVGGGRGQGPLFNPRRA